MSTIGAAAVASAGLLASATGGATKRRKKCKKRCPKCVPKPAGAACDRTSECCGSETNRICSAVMGNNQYVCCGTVGAACAVEGDCCFDFKCVAGACQVGT
jgi:hypothetical protein